MVSGMNSVPVTPPTHRVLANGIGFALLVVSTALAAEAVAMLAGLRGLPVPLFVGVGLALAGLGLGGRRFWPAVLLGLIMAALIRSMGHLATVDLLVCASGTLAAWFGAGLLDRDGDDQMLAPNAVQLLTVGGWIAVVCAVGSLCGAMLRGAPFDIATALRDFAISAPTEGFPALALLSWPAGSVRPPHRPVMTFLAGMIGFATLGIIAFGAIGARPGLWSAIPVLLWSAFAARRRAFGAAVMLVLAGAVLLLWSVLRPGADASLPPALLSEFAMTVTAALLIDSVCVMRQGVAARVLASAARDAEMAAFVTDAPVAIAALDRNLRYRAVSRRYLEDLRLADTRSVIGRRPAEVLASYAAHLGDAPARALAGEHVSCPVGEVRMADGTNQHLRSELQPWHDPEGAVGGIMVSSEITTEAVRSRAALEAAESRYRSVFEQAAAGFARFGLDGSFLEVNDRFCEIVGHERAALLSKTYRDVTHPLDIASCDAMLEAMVARPNERFSVEKRYVARSGRTVWVHLSATMIRDAAGRALYAASAVQDVTARKEAQADLAKSELRLRLAQSAAGAGLWEIDFERDTIIASPDMLRMHGFSPDRTDGVPRSEWRALFDAATRDLMTSTGFGSPDIANHELVYAVEHPDGSHRWIHSMGRTYKTTDHGKRLIGLAIDVTAAQQAQAELQQAQAAMLRVSHLSAMGSVAATLAHELNQPLAAIVNYVEVCAQILGARRDAYPPELRDAVAQAQAQAMRAGQLVQKMRALTTSTASPRRRQSINTIVENACAVIALEGAGGTVAITRHYDQGDGEIVADRMQIEQVLLGIFHNAVEAMRDSAKRRIDVHVSCAGETIVIRIADSGPGLPEVALQRLFEPFANPRGHGSGLTLPVCRTIVEGHDGKLTVEVAPEGGAAFLIALPVAPPRDGAARRESHVAPPRRAMPAQRIATMENRPQ